jgi:hypothetical protein
MSDTHKFCIKCGNSTSTSKEKFAKSELDHSIPKDKWWYRLLKVIYVVSYLPLLGIIPGVWMSNAKSCYYSYYSYTTSCSGSDSEAFWYSFLTLVIYMIVVRLIKIAVLYVAIGQKPEWKRQFRKIF